jgi:hypothetical protein
MGRPGCQVVGIQGVCRELDDLADPLVVCSLHHGVAVACYRVGEQPAPVLVEGIYASDFAVRSAAQKSLSSAACRP